MLWVTFYLECGTTIEPECIIIPIKMGSGHELDASLNWGMILNLPPIAHGEAMELEPMFGVAKRVNTLLNYFIINI